MADKMVLVPCKSNGKNKENDGHYLPKKIACICYFDSGRWYMKINS
jgi:hypothetical protein